jgi:excisionase family DNA binding protein
MEVGGLMETSIINVGVPVSVRIKTAAARLGVSVRTLYRDIADGKLRIVHVRGCSCIEESELQNYIERSKGGKKHD